MLDPKLKQRVIREGLQPYLDDNGQAWEMNSDGVYAAPAPRRGTAPRGAGRTAEDPGAGDLTLRRRVIESPPEWRARTKARPGCSA